MSRGCLEARWFWGGAGPEDGEEACEGEVLGVRVGLGGEDADFGCVGG